MIIKGFTNANNTEYYVFAFLYSSHINLIPLKFVIDTGCTITALGLRDAFQLGFITFTEYPEKTEMDIDNKKELKKIDANINTANGIIDSLVIPDVALTFLNFPNSLHSDLINKILIPLPKLYKSNFQLSVNNSSNILGLDVLKRYKIQFTEDAVYLEK